VGPEGEKMSDPISIHSTTILGLRKDGQAVMIGVGQVTLNNTVMKAKAQKVRRLYEGKVLVGFAGAAADAFTLFREVRGKVGGISRQFAARGGGVGERLANRSGIASAGSASDGDGSAGGAFDLGKRRRDRTR
jgi:hypothetical protein